MTTEELQARIDSVDRCLSEALEEAKKKKKKPYNSMKITTGDIDYNIRQFNKRMGTNFPGNDNNNPSTVEAQTATEACGDSVEGGGGMSESILQESSLVINRVEFETENGRKELEFRWDKGDTYRVSLLSIKDGIGKEDWSKVYYDKDQAERRYKKEVAKAKKEYQLENEYTFESLTEAKREVTRYYIRPQNIWCSNKAEIIKALIEMGDQNCSVYTLKNLDDNKDVHKLTNDDIIYYYDNGILSDKNHVRIMDYDLFVKHEEERKKFAGGVDTIPEDTFKREYEDRLTDKTILESLDDPLRDAVNDSMNYFINSQGITPEVDNVMEDITWNVPGFEDWRKIMPDETEKIKNIKLLINKYMNELTKNLTDKPKNEIKEARISDKAMDATKYAYGFNDKTAKKFIRQADDSMIAELIKEFEITGKHDFYEANTEDKQEETNLNEAVDNPFELTFESYNAFGKRVVEGKEVDDTCCICGEPLEGYGNSPAPYKEEGRCCDNCNVKFVIPARLEHIDSND